MDVIAVDCGLVFVDEAAERDLSIGYLADDGSEGGDECGVGFEVSGGVWVHAEGGADADEFCAEGGGLGVGH